MARVRELRKALNLTQEAFAERAGLQYKYYQHLEAGRRLDIKFSTLQKLAKACGIEPWELLNLDSEPMVLAENSTREPSASRARQRRKR